MGHKNIEHKYSLPQFQGPVNQLTVNLNICKLYLSVFHFASFLHSSTLELTSIFF